MSENLRFAIAAQQRATDPETSVWVSASAGTGKTRVLVDRILRLLLRGTPPERILCLTYTKAAAAEMANRLRQRLAEWQHLEAGKLQESLRQLSGNMPSDAEMRMARGLFDRVVAAPQGVRIQTIHALCQSLLRRFPLEAGISPHFQLLDDDDAKEMLEDARRRLFQQALDERYNALAEALAFFGRHYQEETLTKLITELIAQRRDVSALLEKAGSQHRMAQELAALLGIEQGEDECGYYLQIFALADEEAAALREAIPILQQGKKDDLNLAAALDEYLSLDGDGRFRARNGYLARFLTQKNTPRARLYNVDSAKLLSTLQQELIAREQERAMAWVQWRQCCATHRQTVHLLALAEALFELYEVQKLRINALDYDDLILVTLRLLQQPGIGPWVLYKLDGGLDHLLVDEAQDTSPVQWQIIALLIEDFFSGESARNNRSVFVVGDEKQSIYSFQGADPRSFAGMHERFARAAAQAKMPFIPVRLEFSFRCAPAVLRAVDATFTGKSADGLRFDASEIHHRAQRTQVPGRVELWPVMGTSEESGSDEDDYAPGPAQLLAEELAGRIAGWLEEGRILPGRGRAVRPDDIMVLVRRRTPFLNQLNRQLQRRGIPVAGVDRLSLAEDLAVRDILSVLRFCLLPEDDLNLACLLKTPLLGFSEEAVFALAQGRESSLWAQLGEQQPGTAARLSAWRDRALACGPADFLLWLLDAERGLQVMVARLGRTVIDPLQELLRLAQSYERRHLPSLVGFLQWMRRGDVEVKRNLEQANGQVRVLTTHGAKGLQAPIVILPDTTGLPGRQDMLSWEPDGVAMLWPVKGGDTVSTGWRETAKMVAMQEYRRLLYVAMTRAEDELYVTGWQVRGGVKEGSWYQLMHAAMDAIAARETMPWQGGEAEALVLQDNVPPAPVQAEAPASTSGNIRPEPFQIPSVTLHHSSRLMPASPGSLAIPDESLRRQEVTALLLRRLAEIPAMLHETAARDWLAQWWPEGQAQHGEVLASAMECLAQPVASRAMHPDGERNASFAGMAEDGGIRFAHAESFAFYRRDPEAVYALLWDDLRMDAAATCPRETQQLEHAAQILAAAHPGLAVHLGVVHARIARLRLLDA